MEPPDALKKPKKFHSWQSLLEYQSVVLRLGNSITCLLADWLNHNDVTANANNYEQQFFSARF